MSTTATARQAAPSREDPAFVGGVTPYINVGDASAAAAFYARAFGAEEINRVPAQDGKRLIHCHLRINGGPLMLNDAFPEFGHPLKTPQSFMLHLQVDDVETWWNRAVAAGMEIVLPLDVQFWGERYGQLRDPFGITWSIGGPADAA
jgi:PhnB protein